MSAGNLRCDVQAKTEAFLAFAAVTAEKRLKQSGQRFRGNRRPAIGNPQFKLIASRHTADPDWLAARAVGKCVTEQVRS